MDKQEFQELLQRATGEDIGADEVEQIFRAFDHNDDGKLDYTDCVQFLCATSGRS